MDAYASPPALNATIATALADLPATSAILDGEAVVVDSKGVSDFHSLRRQLGRPKSAILYKVFDLLWFDGEDLRPLPWSESNERLAELLERLPKALARLMSYVEPIHGEGSKVLAGACRLGLEGIVSKRIGRGDSLGGRDLRWRCSQVLRTPCR